MVIQLINDDGCKKGAWNKHSEFFSRCKYLDGQSGNGWLFSVFFLIFYGWMIEPPMAVLSHESWLGFGTPWSEHVRTNHHSDRTYLVYFFQQKQQPNLFSPLNKILITYPVACFNVLHSSIPTLLEDELGVSMFECQRPITIISAGFFQDASCSCFE